MTIGLHNLKTDKGSRVKKRRLGRGNSSGSGTYSGRGQKGQRSRAGGAGGLKRRGLRRMIQNKPKIGGFQTHRPELAIVDLDQLEKQFENGSLVTPKQLKAAGFVPARAAGVKVLGRGKLTKKLNVSAQAFSGSAKTSIEHVGGTATLITVAPKKKSAATASKSKAVKTAKLK